MIDADRRRRLRWAARCIDAMESAPAAHRLSVIDVARQVCLGGYSERDLDDLLAALEKLLIDMLDCPPPKD